MAKLRGSVLDQPYENSNSSSPGRNVPVLLQYNGGAGIPTRGPGATPAITWVSPDGSPKQVRVQLQSVIGGDNITPGSLQFWPSNVRVFYRVRYWLNEASFASLFLSLPCASMQPWTANATKVEVFLYGVTTLPLIPANAALNLPVIVAVSCGEGPDPVTSIASWAQLIPNILQAGAGLAAGEPLQTFRVRVHADVPGMPTGMNVGAQQGIYFGNTPANANLVTLGGTPNRRLGGIAFSITLSGVVGTSKFLWKPLPEDYEETMIAEFNQMVAYPFPQQLTAAGPIALGNTGMTVSFAAGAYVAADTYIFPSFTYYPMLIDINPGPPVNGTNSNYTGPELNWTNGYSADWNIPEGVNTFVGTWLGLSLTPDTLTIPGQYPQKVIWDILATGNAGT